MRFFFPDSQDQIDPTFDFTTEERSPLRVRQRDDLYIHEVLRARVIDGLLVSKAIVDGRARCRREIHPGATASPLPGRSQAVLPPRHRPGRGPGDHGRLRCLQLHQR